jgi:hypothetical protein
MDPLPNASPTPGGVIFDDVISNGVITHSVAADLLDLWVSWSNEPRNCTDHVACPSRFFEHLNINITLFDPMLHALVFIRSKSSLLLSAMLSITARYFGERYRDALAEDADRRLSEAIAKGEVSLETIQALLIHVYWKRPDDTAAWRRMAHAVTLAYEMNLHRAHVRSDPKYGPRGMRVRGWLGL